MPIRSFKGTSPRLGRAVYIDDSAVVIGDVTLGDDVSVWPTTVIRGDVHHVVVGSGTNVQDGCILHVSHDGPYSPGGFALKIGEGVTIGHQAVVHACIVGDHCLVGIGSIIMDGAVVEDRVIIGAGTLVPPGKRLESGHIYTGSPAIKKRSLKQQEFEFLEYSAQHYIRLKDQYLHGQ